MSLVALRWTLATVTIFYMAGPYNFKEMRCGDQIWSEMMPFYAVYHSLKTQPEFAKSKQKRLFSWQTCLNTFDIQQWISLAFE